MALSSVTAVKTLTSILLIVPLSLTNSSSVVARPEVKAVCPDITLSFMCSLSTALSAILASVIASAAILAVVTLASAHFAVVTFASTIEAVTTALDANSSAPTASSANIEFAIAPAPITRSIVLSAS